MFPEVPLSILHGCPWVNQAHTLTPVCAFQVIPAENIVAAFQGTRKTIFAVSKTPSEAQIFLEVVSLIKMSLVMDIYAFPKFINSYCNVWGMYSLVGIGARFGWCGFENWGCWICFWAEGDTFIFSLSYMYEFHEPYDVYPLRLI